MRGPGKLRSMRSEVCREEGAAKLCKRVCPVYCLIQAAAMF